MMILAADLAKDWGINISQIPLCGCAPEWMSEKAVSIGNYVVATGIDTYLGVDPYSKGSSEITELLQGETRGCKEWVEAHFVVDTNIESLGDKMIAAIDKLIRSFEREGYKESYFYYLYENRAAAYAALGNFEAAYRDIQHYTELYHKQVNDDNEKTLGEFATLLDVNRLNMEKAELRQQAQEERLHRTQLGTIGLACILLLAAVFIAVMLRMNRHLARAKRAAEESNRMKGIFIRNITHEINTPLNSIVGFAELAAASDDADAAERQSYISIIQENSGYLQKLVDAVLYIAGLESSETPPAMSPTDINECCQECIQKVSQSSSRAVSIRFVPAREKFHLHTSCMLISKAITEMLRNAVHFAADGEITLAYTLDGGNRRITFTVTDSGPGIPACEAEHIFGRFVKLDTFSQGLGRGLTVCRLIASALGGTIKLDTNYSGGARFALSIPLR